MRIESIGIIHIRMPLREPFRTACGDDADNGAVLVGLTSGGITGWGEASPGTAPTYCPECAATQFVVSRDFIAPLLAGRVIDSGADLQDRLSHIRGNRFAKAAFDLAWWDLAAKMAGTPLWRFIGGAGPTAVTGADIGVLDSIDELLGTIAEAVADGCRRVKLKCRPGWDAGMAAAVRARFPETVFHIDCNSAYTPEDIGVLHELDRHRFAMIEQPLSHDDLVDHAELARVLETPVCLDESVTSPDDARRALSIGACRWINIKPGRVGGITPALAIHALCREQGVGCWIGGMLETAVGASHCLALATLPGLGYPSDVFPSSRFHRCDPGTPPLVHSAPSEITARDVPGCGAEPDPEMMERLTVERVEV